MHGIEGMENPPPAHCVRPPRKHGQEEYDSINDSQIASGDGQSFNQSGQSVPRRQLSYTNGSGGAVNLGFDSGNASASASGDISRSTTSTTQMSETPSGQASGGIFITESPSTHRFVRQQPEVQPTQNSQPNASVIYQPDGSYITAGEHAQSGNAANNRDSTKSDNSLGYLRSVQTVERI